MQSLRLKMDFYERKTLTVAHELLGKKLVFGRRSAIITEVEAYIGENDPACHAAAGKTPRNAIMYGPAGFSYIYFIYGMYHCLNVVTERAGFPAAVLIRGAKQLNVSEFKKYEQKCLEPRKDGVKVLAAGNQDSPLRLLNGPGKLCLAFGLDRSHSGLDLSSETNFYIADIGIKPKNIVKTPRIGIKKGKNLPWRFVFDF